MEQMKLPFDVEEIARFSVGDQVRVLEDYIDDLYNDYFPDDYDDEDDGYNEDERDRHMNYLEGVFEIIRVDKVFSKYNGDFIRFEYYVESENDMWFYDREIEGV